MNIGDRVRIVAGKHFYGPPQAIMGREGIVIGYATTSTHLPKTIVRLDEGDEWACYEDEMEIVSAGEQKEA